MPFQIFTVPSKLEVANISYVLFPVNPVTVSEWSSSLACILGLPIKILKNYLSIKNTNFLCFIRNTIHQHPIQIRDHAQIKILVNTFINM